MCGIAGFCDFNADFLKDAEKCKQVLVDMRTAIAHRGHDQTGEYLNRHIGLAHTRLSIRDLVGGTQPMLRDACKDLLPPELLYRKKSPYPKTYSPVYEALLSERFEQMLQNKQAPIHRFLDNKKAERFLAQPKDYGKPWFGQLMAGPQMLAYFLQVNDSMEMYGIS